MPNIVWWKIAQVEYCANQVLSFCQSQMKVPTWVSNLFSNRKGISPLAFPDGDIIKRPLYILSSPLHQSVYSSWCDAHPSSFSCRHNTCLSWFWPMDSLPFWYTRQEKQFYPQYLDSIHKQSIPMGLFEYSPLHKPIMPIVLFGSSLRALLSQSIANFSRLISTKQIVVVALTPTNHLVSDNPLVSPKYQRFGSLPRPCGILINTILSYDCNTTAEANRMPSLQRPKNNTEWWWKTCEYRGNPAPTWTEAQWICHQ